MAIGIITEYNPFHNGHLLHIRTIKERFGNEPIIAVMSGHFVQRGGPALCDKWSRAEVAVRCGADLVLELPVLYASQSAEIFAKGSISILKATGIVQHLVFGSETNNIDNLSHTAHMLLHHQKSLNETLQYYLRQGFSFASARSKAALQLNILLPEKSNDILGIEYIKQILLQQATIIPHSILRKNSSYHSTDKVGDICSATAVRHALFRESPESLQEIRPFVPEPMLWTIQNTKNISEEDFFDMIRYIVIRDSSSLHDTFEVREGLEHSVYSAALSASSLDHLMQRLKSKRYTMTKIRRMLFNILLDIRKSSMRELLALEELPYLRVLAFNDIGRQCLKKIKHQADIVNKASSFVPQNRLQEILWHHDLRATQIYYLKYHPSESAFADYIISPKYLCNKKTP